MEALDLWSGLYLITWVPLGDVAPLLPVMAYHQKDQSRSSLAERSVTEALRVFARLDHSQGMRHVSAPTLLGGTLADDALIALVDELTLKPEPPARAMLVYSPTALALDTLRHDVSSDDWARHAAPAAPLRVGALRGGVLVALASADRPEGKLSRVRVLVSPAFRHHGLGHLVLHHMVRRVLQEGLLPYAKLTANDLTARALAKAVGFVNLARQVSLAGLSVSPT